MSEEEFESLKALVRRATGAAALEFVLMREYRVRVVIGDAQLFVFLEPDEDVEHWARQIVARVKQSVTFVPLA